MNILHLDSSILGPGSVSRELSAKAVAHVIQSHPHAKVVYHDLVANPVPHLSEGSFAAIGGSQADLDAAIQADLTIGGKALDDFMNAEIVVIGVAFYNFSISSQLKTWIDRIVMPGKTFRYEEGRPVGLAGDKRVILTMSRGGFYEPGEPAAPLEHCESYLRSTFGFLGVTHIDVIVAPGVRAGPEQRVAAIADAIGKIAALAV